MATPLRLGDDDARPLKSGRRLGSVVRVNDDRWGQRTSRVRRPRALVVDDEEQNLEYVRRCLRDLYDVDCVAAGRDALELVAKNDYDVIISDQRMPGMTGSEFLAAALDATPQSLRIIITGYSDLDAIASAVNNAGVSSFIRKPFTRTDITGAIDKAHQLQRRQKPNREPPALQDVLDGLADGVATIAGQELTYANRTLRELLGLSELGPVRIGTLLGMVESADALAEAIDTNAHGAHFEVTLIDRRGARHPCVVRTRVSAGHLVLTFTATARSPGLQRPSVLVVDQDPSIVRCLDRLLARSYDVYAAASSKQAAEHLESRGADVVLADLATLGQDNYERLLLRFPGLRESFVAITSALVPGDGSTMTPSDLSLDKPFGYTDLHDVVNRVVTRGQKTRGA